MCGILGVVEAPDAAGLLVDGLRRVEYRGYDSCGYAVLRGQTLVVEKKTGGVAGLSKIGDGSETVGIGHTRWATHGRVTTANAHPHVDCTGRIAIVHNGTLDNHADLRARLAADGHAFASETDSEVIAHLLEEHPSEPLLGALQRTILLLRGTFAILAVRAPGGEVAFARRGTPLVVGVRGSSRFVASDAIALGPLADDVDWIEEGETGLLAPGVLQIHDSVGRPRAFRPVRVQWAAEASEKAGFAHYMAKEIHEAPQVVNRVLLGRVFLSPPYLELQIDDALLRGIRRVKLIGSGTSHHACLLGAAYLRELAGVAAQAELSSEYKDAVGSEEPGTLLVVVSQSGETFDTLQALRRLENHGHPVIAVTNEALSSLGRSVDGVLELRAGPEISVGATKTFVAQVIVLLLLALRIARIQGRIGDSELAWFAHRLRALPRVFSQTLLDTRPVTEAGRFLARFEHSFVLGKGLGAFAAEEGALKFKEIAYQHSEASAAGELKHGPFALLTSATPVIALVPGNGGAAKVVNTLLEVEARGSPLVVLSAAPTDWAHGNVHWIPVPPVHELLEPIVHAHLMHLLAYETAKQRGCEIDRPRNLAKSVTVE